ADVLLVTDFRYDEQARAEAGEVARVEVDSTSVWDRFFQELATLGPVGTLGYEAHALSVHDAERFAQAGKAWRWVPTTDLVERLRAAKDEVEVAAIRGAAQLAGEALRQTLVQVRPGMTELAIAGVLEGALRRLGSEGHPFATIVASGPRSALPHARSSRRSVTGSGSRCTKRRATRRPTPIPCRPTRSSPSSRACTSRGTAGCGSKTTCISPRRGRSS